LITGLFDAIKVAHEDGHSVLFDRAKSVLSTMAKHGISGENQNSPEAIKE